MRPGLRDADSGLVPGFSGVRPNRSSSGLADRSQRSGTNVQGPEINPSHHTRTPGEFQKVDLRIGLYICAQASNPALPRHS